MFGVILNGKTFYDEFSSLEDAKSFAFKLADSMPYPLFKSVKVVEVKELNYE